MKILFLIPILLLLSCASKSNLSGQYKFTGILNVVVNGSDVSKDCFLVLNSKQGFAWNIHKIKIENDGSLNFSSKLKENYLNEITCTPGFIASEIKYSFKKDDIRINALKSSDHNLGKVIFDWKTGSYAGAVVGGVAVDIITGLNTSKNRSNDKFLVKHITDKQKNTQVLISKRLLSSNK